MFYNVRARLLLLSGKKTLDENGEAVQQGQSADCEVLGARLSPEPSLSHKANTPCQLDSRTHWITFAAYSCRGKKLSRNGWRVKFSWRQKCARLYYSRLPFTKWLDKRNVIKNIVFHLAHFHSFSHRLYLGSQVLSLLWLINDNL